MDIVPCDACQDPWGEWSDEMQRTLCEDCRKELEEGYVPPPTYDHLMLKGADALVPRMKEGHKKIRS